MPLVEFTGKVMSGSETLFAAVSGHYLLKRGDQSWHGQLTLESGEAPSMFSGRFVTDNGQQDEIIATDVYFGSPTISFRGTGPFE